MKAKKVHDVMIIGGGPAGLTAGLYASRARLDAVLFEKASHGGQITVTEKLENYPGIPEDTGPGLAAKFHSHAVRFGLECVDAEIVKLEEGKKGFSLVDGGGNSHEALSVIIASGAEWRKLGVPGEDKFQGRGVSYCATCDGPLYRDKEIVVVGGGNAAAEEILFLTKFVKRATLIHRRGMLRATKILQEELSDNKKVVLKLESVITRIEGDKLVESVVVRNVKTAKEGKLPCRGVFVFIGQDPNVGFLKGTLEADEHGYIVTDEAMRTSKEGVFAAGDVRRKVLRQVITAASDGAVAAYSAEQYVRRLKGQEYK